MVVVVVAPMPYEWVDPYGPGVPGMVGPITPIPKEGPLEVQPLLDHARKRLEETGSAGEAVWGLGDPVSEILRVADERKAVRSSSARITTRRSAGSSGPTPPPTSSKRRIAMSSSRADRPVVAHRDLNGNGRLDPYEDPAQPLEARVADLLSQMTLEEKAGLMFHPPILMNGDGTLIEDDDDFFRGNTEDLVAAASA